MRLARLFTILTILLVAVVPAAFARLRVDPPQPFPHRAHAKLFPASCAGCHAGIPTESAIDRFPTPASCADCHDGKEQKRVAWTGRKRPATNLDFSHAEHARESRRDGAAQQCQSCHRDRGAPAPVAMAVSRAAPENCVSCHAHRAPEHLAEQAKCSSCHLPLARAAALADSDIARFPEPPTHRLPDFVSSHGAGLDARANCATCHSRESCARCHPNAARIAERARLEPDRRVARLVRDLAPEYPTPASHRAPLWAEAHGPDAKRDAGSCANCHTQASCNGCHVARTAPRPRALTASAATARATALLVTPQGAPGPRAAPAVVSTVAPAASDTVPAPAGPGVTLRRTSVHPPDFERTHGASAGSERLNCTTCHTRRQCTECHDGASRRRFHPSNYMSRHAPDSYGGERSCTSCHNAETFCRSCHQGNGIASRGSGVLGAAAHNGQPLWLLQHAQAARQGLEGCTTCHQQRDCMRCHSEAGRKVSPHGAGFDARRAAARNRQTCMTCHLTDPLANLR